MKTLISLGIGLLFTLVGASALAQKMNMTPGLWEHTVDISSHGDEMAMAMKEMQKQLAQMPPEQRKAMEDMLASQGIGFGEKGASVRLCMTREQIDRGQIPQHDDNCTHEITEQTASKFKMKFSCQGNPPSSGSGEMHFIDSKNFTGTSSFTTESDGKKEEMTMTQTGRWLSADCGNIKPIKSQ